MLWCEQVLGIYTILEIQTFEYYDYMQALTNSDDDDDDWGAPEFEFTDRSNVDVENLPMIPVRGLAASRDIEIGEVVIRIPLQALLTVSTTIDQDPVLSRVLGPQARQDHGWMGDDSADDNDDNTRTDESVYLLEMPLLAVALLHHQKLGAASPLKAYIRLLESSSTDTMPFLWSDAKLKATASPGVRTVARGIQQEVRDMYDTIVQVLIKEHPDLFGPPALPVPPYNTHTANTSHSGGSNNNSHNEKEKEWMFSFEHFRWAFAMVTSRHWQLPISDLERPEAAGAFHGATNIHATTTDEQVPPADMPTDMWTQEHGDVPKEANNNNNNNNERSQKSQPANSHSFLAPVADLLNFGPPCTTGRYNAASHTFDIVASCSFQTGQEVTFWYSDECDDIIAGSYGFTHPMVPKCPTAQDWRYTSEEWRGKAELLAEQLGEAYDDLNHLYEELEHAQDILNGCDCCRYEKRVASNSNGNGNNMKGSRRERLRHEPSVRGGKAPSSSNRDDDIERHGVRRMWRDRSKSEF
jgi:hypothetical protein